MSRSSLGFVQAGTFKAILSPKLSAVGSIRGSIINCSFLTSSNHIHTLHITRGTSLALSGVTAISDGREQLFFHLVSWIRLRQTGKTPPATLTIALWSTACTLLTFLLSFFIAKEKNQKREKKKKREKSRAKNGEYWLKKTAH